MKFLLSILLAIIAIFLINTAYCGDGPPLRENNVTPVGDFSPAEILAESSSSSSSMLLDEESAAIEKCEGPEELEK
uniref:Uncharacterized protein n=1 Tax=Rhabditophanes sp. KR3021 TaxID=114890 RepID=A0AC35U9H8_9BILA